MAPKRYNTCIQIRISFNRPTNLFLSNEKFTCAGCFVLEDILFPSFHFIKTWSLEAPTCDKEECLRIDIKKNAYELIYSNLQYLTHTSAQ